MLFYCDNKKKRFTPGHQLQDDQPIEDAFAWEDSMKIKINNEYSNDILYSSDRSSSFEFLYFRLCMPVIVAK